MEWRSDNTIKVDAPKKPKKLTGTRFGAVLGLNVWKTPFEVWCEMTRTYEQPFEENIYTICGKVIEDRQCKFLHKTYLPLDEVIKPEDIYGQDFFKKTYGDFYPEQKIFGGMWDALVRDEQGNITAVVECKTTKRAEDWVDSNGQVVVPEYYALQGALYAYLLGVDNVYMIVSVLEEADYVEVQKLINKMGIDRVERMVEDGTIKDFVLYQPSAENTSVINFKVSEKYPNFFDLVNQAEKWHEEHIKTGISPVYDEKKDADILKELRKNNINPDTDLNELLIEYEQLDEFLTHYYEEVKGKEDRLKVVKDQITALMREQLRDGDKQVVATTDDSTFTLTKTVRNTVDSKKLASDGLLEQYQTTSESYTLKRKGNKEE